MVAITCDRRLGSPGSGPKVRPARSQIVVAESVVERVRAAGGVPILLPPGDAASTSALLERFDALIVTGGAMDIHPRHYGAPVLARLDRVEEDRTALELALLRTVATTGQPVLGICGGMQALAVALGGTLVQDLGALWPGAQEHEQPTDPATPWHAITAEPAWEAVFGPVVNSTHHQAVDDPGALRVLARADDGVIEAVHLPGHPFCVGVQWHPELLDGRLFEALVSSCR